MISSGCISVNHVITGKEWIEVAVEWNGRRLIRINSLKIASMDWKHLRQRHLRYLASKFGYGVNSEPAITTTGPDHNR